MKKYEKDGKIAVLVSHGYGAGWSTWASDDSVVYSPKVVKHIIENKEITEEELKKIHPKEYCGGAGGLKIHWIEKGTKFRITEYDGAEELEIIDELDHNVA